MVGAVGLNLHAERQAGEAGYWVVPGDRGRGIAPAAVALIERWAFDELQLQRLELVIHVDNQLLAEGRRQGRLQPRGRAALVPAAPRHAGRLLALQPAAVRPQRAAGLASPARRTRAETPGGEPA